MKFNFNPVKKVVIEHRPVIVEENVLGLVYVITPWEYRIKTQTNDYPVHPKSISCKGKSTIYKTTLDKRGNIVKVLRHNKDELLKYFFMPFQPGNIVKGNIIKSNNVLYFQVTKITSDWCEDSNYVYNKFKEEYKEINNTRIEQLVNYYNSE